MGNWGVALGPEVVAQIPRADRADRARPSGGGRPAHARRHHRGRDQHSLSHRQQPVGRRGAVADPHDEENHQNFRRGRSQAARSQPQRQTASAGDRPRGARQRPTQSRETGAGLPKITRPGGGASQALCQADRRRRQAGGGRLATSRAGRVASRAGQQGSRWCSR